MEGFLEMATVYTVTVVALLAASAFALNLPFGYLRGKTRKFSFLWFLYIHLPVPFIFLMRTYAGFSYKIIPLLVAGAIVGQLLGGRLRNLRVSQ